MDRSTLLRYLGIVGVAIVFVVFILPKLTGGDGPKTQDLGAEGKSAPAQRAPEQLCLIEGERFHAAVSTRGASLKSMRLTGAKYTVDGRPQSPPIDLVTTPDIESRQPLRTELRAPGADNQVEYDLIDWKLDGQGGKECRFSFVDPKVELHKTVRATGRPFELESELTVKNLSDKRLTHRTSYETTAWHTEKSIEGGFGRQSPWVTQVECLQGGKLLEHGVGDFSPKETHKTELFKNGWLQVGAPVDFAATSNFYFAQAIVPVDGPSPALCELQIEDRYHPQYGSKKDDPSGGSMYRSRIAWAPKELGPNETATYKAIHFAGPKERDVLSQAAGGTHHLSELIRLGMLAPIAKVLVAFLTKTHGLIGSWGLSIILMTVSVRTVLFPLTWKTIKNGAKMRQMKPEVDALNEKYAHDPQQKQLATMELWKKHGVNPVAGCLPMVAQMPVWFALYTTLQTAAELFHTPFLWFGDLSAPDTIHVGHWDVPFILPALLGVTTFVQQKIMPQQQMDPAQQKMMTYMMPAIFTAMMLFLPAGLGVYMFTNSLLGIVQQLAVEKYYSSQGGGGGTGISVREKDGDAQKSPAGKKDPSAALALGKGNARV
jgi:YidC/Oxa1 family membrane protein insertase